jgi:uncharacterized membrane protein YhhN
MVSVALALAAVLAIADWMAVAGRLPAPLRWLTKPGAMVLLIVAVVAADASGPFTTWLIVGLVWSLVGDVVLMLPERWFVAGLGSFLVAHVAYVVAMAQLELTGWAIVTGGAIVAATWVKVGLPIIAGAAARAAQLRVPVTLYIAVISAMVVVALGTTEPWLVAAALAFFASDAVLGTNRFVTAKPWMPVTVMVTYHLAQFCFVAFVVGR